MLAVHLSAVRTKNAEYIRLSIDPAAAAATVTKVHIKMTPSQQLRGHFKNTLKCCMYVCLQQKCFCEPMTKT